MQPNEASSIFAFFKDKQNPEFGQAVIRLLLGILICSYGFYVYFTGWYGGMPENAFQVTMAYLIFSIVNFTSVIAYPKPHVIRKIFNITIDLSTATYMLIVGGVATAALYGIYLWVILANGLRYGAIYMRLTNIMAIAGFSTVLWYSEFWRENIIFGWGLLLWLFLLPIYVEKLLLRIEVAVDRANAANSAKSQFLANMSHEIRTPLTAIIGFAEAALDPNQSESEKKSALKTIAQSGNHLLTIINDILDFSKIEANKLEIEIVESNPFQIIHDVKSLMLEVASQKGLTLQIHYQFPLPSMIHTDPVRLRQILINLCSNAIKFTQTGTVDIVVEHNPSKNQMSFCISDTGIGMTEMQIAKIFKPFVQADTSTTRQYGGTGLGLALSRQLAELLGGTLSVASKQGKGSRFTLCIDNCVSSNIKLVNEITEINSSDFSQAKISDSLRLTGEILIAEDNPNNQQLFTLILKKIGINVTLADNGKEALAKATEKVFDLIFMDMQMPVMSGLEAVKKLRAQHYCAPIVALTANATKADRKLCLDAGCDNFLTKPVLHHQLYQMAANYLPVNNDVMTEASPLVSNILEEEPDFADLVEKFVNQLPSNIEKINEHMLEEKWQLLKADIHSLKGVGSAFGYPQLTDIAKNIELALAATDFATTQELITSLNHTCDRIYLGIHNHRKSA